MSTLKVDNITNYAGTGSPDFANGLQISSPSVVHVDIGNGFGSTNIKIRRFTTVVTNTGSDITYADSATLGGSFTINTDGIYAITYTDRKNSGGFELMGVTVNGDGTASINNQLGNSRGHTSVDPANSPDMTVTMITKLSNGDVVRPHVQLSDGAYSLQATGRNRFQIILLYKT